MLDPIVGAAVVGAVPSTLAAVLAYRATLHGRRNGAALNVVQQQTNGEMDHKIRAAVREVFREDPNQVTQAVVSEALRDLLDGILEAARSEE